MKLSPQQLQALAFLSNNKPLLDILQALANEALRKCGTLPAEHVAIEQGKFQAYDFLLAAIRTAANDYDAARRQSGDLRFSPINPTTF